MCVLWGIPYLLIKVAVRDFSPVAVVFLRTGIGAVVLLPVVLVRRELGQVLRAWRWVLIYTAVEVTIPWLMLSAAEERLPSSLVGLLVAAVPLVTAILLLVTRADDRVDWRRGLGVPRGEVVPAEGGENLVRGVPSEGTVAAVVIVEVAEPVVSLAALPL
jgi:drug/metabolite transporter (DMT)-like permease